MPVKTKRSITPQDIYSFELVSDVRLSPDGRNVIYAVQHIDRKREKKYSNLWLAAVDDGEPRQFTFGDQNDGMARWSPDGSQIAFLSNRADKEKPSQIYLIGMNGGEARPLVAIEGEVSGLSWSPDGKRLLCTVRKTDAEALERRKDEQKKKLGVVVRQVERVFYKLDGYGYLPKERTHLWTVDVRTGKTRQLTDHAVYDEHGSSWSPDGRKVAFVSNRSANPDFNPDADDLYVMPAAGGEFTKIETPAGSKGSPIFSPDGKWLAYYGNDYPGEWYRNTCLWVVPVDGSLPARNLTRQTDLHISSGVINDAGSPEFMPPTWSKDSQRIYFQVDLHGSTLLMSIALDGSNLQTVIGAGGALGSYTFDREQNKLVYFYGRMHDPVQIFYHNLADGNERQLTRLNQDWLSKIELGEVEEVWFKGRDGNDLQGWIIKPPGFDASRRYPSIMEIHGGPLVQYGNYFMHEFYYLAAQGYVVYFCNPRGGRGYGEAHAGAIWGGWGDADYADLMAWADYVEKLPYIDAQRMGVTGGSYGGYMTVWIIGHTQRFKAAVTQRCVSNLISLWGSSDMNWSFQEVLNNQPPFKDLQKFWDHSPIKYIDNAKTPTLVLHNEFDLRCPIEQGEQVFVALKSLGVDTEMVRFPDEPHGLSRIGRTDRRIARLEHIARWFNQYLKN